MAELPIACTLTPEALRTRREGLLRDLVRRAERRDNLPDGLRLEFAPSAETIALIAQAVEAERHCCRFLRFAMSHEIRTPMNAIIGLCNVLLRTGLHPRQNEYAGNIKDSANALLTVINDILDFSKIEAGRLDLEIVDFDLVKIVESMCELLATSARAKQLALMAYIDPNLPKQLRGDPERLRQVLLNLTSNAIKFSEHGAIVVRAELESLESNVAHVRFSVVDQGVGLSPSEQARLFQPFVQADGSISRRFGGTGLGLSISKRIVELMNGEIGVESIKDSGSTFWFSIPLECRSEYPSLSLKAELTGVRVLIVDDEPNARTILRDYILSWGMKDGLAVSARDALKALRQAYVDGDPFKIAIIDFMMPSQNGADLSKEILSDPAISQTHLILLTAFDAPGLGLQAMELGFSAYLTKPVRQSQLLDCVVNVLSGAQAIGRSAADAKLIVRESDAMRPGLAAVAGLVHAVAVAAGNRITAADVNDVGIGRRDHDRADAVDVGQLVDDRNPRHSRARRPPHATHRRADVKRAGLADHAGHGRDPAAVERADVAPREPGVEVIAERWCRLPLLARGKARRSGRGVHSERDGAGEHKSRQGE